MLPDGPSADPGAGGQGLIGVCGERVFLFGPWAQPLGSVSYASVVTVSVESHATVLARFNETRLMRLGHRLLAFRSPETADGCSVVVEWDDEDGHHHDGRFCFEGLAADVRARGLRDAILHHAAHHRRVTGQPGPESFRLLLDDFEIRRCEHCGKIHRPVSATRRESAP